MQGFQRWEKVQQLLEGIDTGRLFVIDTYEVDGDGTSSADIGDCSLQGGKQGELDDCHLSTVSHIMDELSLVGIVRQSLQISAHAVGDLSPACESRVIVVPVQGAGQRNIFILLLWRRRDDTGPGPFLPVDAYQDFFELYAILETGAFR